jgi:hypothetical protein
MGFQDIFHDLTSRLMLRIGILLALGIGLLAFGDYLQPRLDCTIWHLLPGVIVHTGTALIVASAVIVAIDISLRKDFIDDISRVVKSLKTQERSGIRQTVYERKQLDSEITQDLLTATPGTDIRVVGIAQKDFFTDQPGHATVRDTIRDGCSFRVLLLHPESNLLLCVQNLSKLFGSPDIKLSIRAALMGTVKSTFDEVQKLQPHLAGSLEVRLHKDVFSTLFLYIGHATVVCGTYLSHRRGRLSPAFVVEDNQLRSLLVDHFERLWTVSEQHRLCRVSSTETVDNFDSYRV